LSKRSTKVELRKPSGLLHNIVHEIEPETVDRMLKQ